MKTIRYGISMAVAILAFFLAICTTIEMNVSPLGVIAGFAVMLTGFYAALNICAEIK